MAGERGQAKPGKGLTVSVEPLPAGRSRVQVLGGALEHTDQLRLSSDRQRLRVAQACDAKEPGCLDEVLDLLEREAVRQRVRVDPREDDGCRFVFTGADKLLPEPVDWLWEHYIPAGAVTILEGDPGVGKSLVLADLAARVSRGFLAPDRSPAFDEPGHDPEPCPERVWWFSGQDHGERTLAPRLLAAGADLPMVRVIEGVEDRKSGRCRPVAFPEDFPSLWQSQAAAPRLVVVDPLTSFCGGSFHQATARKVLGELSKFAAATGAAVVVVRPLNRRVGASASERGSAGPSLTAEARSALLLAQHPDDPDKQVLAVVKSNLCAKAPSLELRIEEGAEGPRVAWLGQSPLTADELVRVNKQGASAPRSPFEQKKVEEWLGEKLAAGPKLATEIDEQAKLDEVPPILLKRARISLGIIPAGSNGHTIWTLPDVGWAPPTGVGPAPLVVGGAHPTGPRGRPAVDGVAGSETGHNEGAETGHNIPPAALAFPPPAAGEGDELASRVGGPEVDPPPLKERTATEASTEARPELGRGRDVVTHPPPARKRATSPARGEVNQGPEFGIAEATCGDDSRRRNC